MLVLFDQGTPVAIRNARPEHSIRTAYEQGWSALLNGELLREAEKAGLEVLLTTDKSLHLQQNLAGRSIAVVALGQARWSVLKAVLPQIAEAVRNALPGTCNLVEIPLPGTSKSVRSDK